jgi:uncharacterized protein
VSDSNKSDKIFSGLEHLGFDNIDNLKIFGNDEIKEKEKIKNTEKQSEQEKQWNLLYDKEIMCPVCNSKFKARSVKTSASRMIKKDSDFFIHYENINPYFYDVWLCNSCGYASMKHDFNKIKEYQMEKVKKYISSKWKGSKYPDIYDVSIAIERYKLSLLNYCIIDSRASCKALNCLKLAWMYRLCDDHENELSFIKQALEGFNEAYYNEDFPIYGMDRYATMYLIGELYRKSTNNEQALLWFSKIITSPSIPQKIKDMARDQRELIKDSASEQKEDGALPLVAEVEKKKGFFSRFFK